MTAIPYCTGCKKNPASHPSDYCRECLDRICSACSSRFGVHGLRFDCPGGTTVFQAQEPKVPAQGLCSECNVNPTKGCYCEPCLKRVCANCGEIWGMHSDNICMIKPGTFRLLVPVALERPVTNDHVCPSCHNDRCSKSEKTCWLCGSNLHP